MKFRSLRRQKGVVATEYIVGAVALLIVFVYIYNTGLDLFHDYSDNYTNQAAYPF